MKITERIFDAATGLTTDNDREATAEELAKFEFAKAANKSALETEAQKAADKAALLTKLGITDDEAKLLLS
jgi:hypothetical protein